MGVRTQEPGSLSTWERGLSLQLSPGSPGWCWSFGLVLSAGRETHLCSLCQSPRGNQVADLEHFACTVCSMDRPSQRLEVQGVEKGNKKQK